METGQSPSKANEAMLAAEERDSTKGASSTSCSPLRPTGRDSGPFDVFLSFKGSETRKEFTDHLYHRLVATEIRVFRDRESLPKGEDFRSQLLAAIRESKILIPVISEKYASSKWCLLELIHIMDCKKKKSHIVLPIFYKLDPSDVRYLKGNFEKAFDLRKHRFDEKLIKEGKEALEAVSYLDGWNSSEFADGHEGELIERVVETVLGELRKDFPLLVPKELVGLDDQLKKIISRIDSPSINARMIGIYGMGGIGKTTLAKCIYNQLSNKFGHVCFLPNIRETTERHGIENLQSRLISEILLEKNAVSTVDLGINLIKSRFVGKKVLILLDDIDHKDQLDALAGGGYWFASGSIIIVTTRNKAVLDQSEFEVDYKHEMSGINEVNSLILFKRHAFRIEHPLGDFASVSREIVSTMGGLPLALKVIGSYLYKKTNPKVWDDILKQLKKKPHEDVQKILKISYDALQDGHREIFLDIACFFIGEKIEYAMYMWEDCEFYASQGIEELKLRCLIKIEDDGKFSMHDQLRDLGRNIICQGRPPEKRSRLWLNEEATKVLEEEKGTKRIQAIRLNWYRYWYSGYPRQAYTNEQFKKLPKLRFLQLKQVALNGDFNKLFSELRWLQWFNIEPDPSFVATNLLLPKLVVLSLSNSPITEHWGGWSSIVVAKQLKVLDLTYCKHLRCTPELSAFTKLEILILKGCSKLEQVHPSIGKVESLISLDLSDCCCLKELSGEVGKLRELKKLILDSSSIREIPTSVGSMRKLEKLSAQSCRSLTKIPSSMGDLPNLQHLNISKTAISVLPESIKNLSSLKHLHYRDSKELRLLSELPSGLTHLELSFQSPQLPQFSRLNHMKELNISWTRST